MVSNGLTKCQVSLVTKIVEILWICSVDARVNAESPIHFQTFGVILLLSRNRNKFRVSLAIYELFIRSGAKKNYNDPPDRRGLGNVLDVSLIWVELQEKTRHM